MPLRKHKPIPEGEITRRGSNDQTLCQTLRDVYKLTGDPLARLKLRIAMSMAKSMDKKLREYNEHWKEGFYDKREHDHG